MKRIMLLGASGSIGKQTIDVLREHKDELQLVGASVGKNIDALIDILNEFPVKYAYTMIINKELINRFPKVTFFYGDEGLEKMAALDDYDMLVNSLVGFVGFKPTLIAINNKKDIALANKETLVAGGEIINAAIKENNVKLYPIDSEHSAIFQCLQGHSPEDVSRLIITASGGAFRDYSRAELKNATLDKALAHPTWNMGAKITIDSATMMNKGFEVIEAHYLFNIPFEKIDVIIHPQSMIHSMVEYNDGSIIAQIGVPDMHLPIKYALLYPNHKMDACAKYLNFDDITNFEFRKMDYDRYPLVRLAKQVGQYGGDFGAYLIGANDEAVNLFLNNKINFIDIEEYIFETLKQAHFKKDADPDDLINAHEWARSKVDYKWANS